MSKELETTHEYLLRVGGDTLPEEASIICIIKDKICNKVHKVAQRNRHFKIGGLGH